MKYLRIILTALVIIMGICAQAHAQLEVRLSTERGEYVPGEDVPLTVTITNHTDATVRLSNVPGRPWLHIHLTRQGSGTAVVPNSIPRYPECVLSPGGRKAFSISLKPHYALTNDGSYGATVTLRMPDGQTTYTSNRAVFGLSSGGTMRSFTIQARGQKLVTSIKLLSIKGLSYVFGQVVDASSRKPLGACMLGRYVNFMAPRVLLDSAQNMHVLMQSTPVFYTYAVMDTYGRRRSHEVLERTGGPVDLISTGGGIKYIGLRRYKKPTELESVPSANARP